MCDPVTALVAVVGGAYMNEEKRKMQSQAQDAATQAQETAQAAQTAAQQRADGEIAAVKQSQIDANVTANQNLAGDKQRRRMNVLASGGSTDALGGGGMAGQPKTSVLGGAAA